MQQRKVAHGPSAAVPRDVGAERFERHAAALEFPDVRVAEHLEFRRHIAILRKFRARGEVELRRMREREIRERVHGTRERAHICGAQHGREIEARSQAQLGGARLRVEVSGGLELSFRIRGVEALEEQSVVLPDCGERERRERIASAADFFAAKLRLDCEVAGLPEVAAESHRERGQRAVVAQRGEFAHECLRERVAFAAIFLPLKRHARRDEQAAIRTHADAEDDRIEPRDLHLVRREKDARIQPVHAHGGAERVLRVERDLQRRVHECERVEEGLVLCGVRVVRLDDHLVHLRDHAVARRRVVDFHVLRDESAERAHGEPREGHLDAVLAHLLHDPLAPRFREAAIIQVAPADDCCEQKGEEQDLQEAPHAASIPRSPRHRQRILPLARARRPRSNRMKPRMGFRNFEDRQTKAHLCFIRVASCPFVVHIGPPRAISAARKNVQRA